MAGDRSPAFSITTEQGRHISPTAFGGRILVVNFRETSCVPCAKELPSLSEIAHRFQREGLVVVAEGADEDAGKPSRFLREHRVVL